MIPTYVPPTLAALFEYQAVHGDAPTVPLRRRRWSWAAVVAVAVVVALATGTVSYHVALWLVEGMRVAR